MSASTWAHVFKFVETVKNWPAQTIKDTPFAEYDCVRELALINSVGEHELIDGLRCTWEYGRTESANGRTIRPVKKYNVQGVTKIAGSSRHKSKTSLPPNGDQVLPLF